MENDLIKRINDTLLNISKTEDNDPLTGLLSECKEILEKNKAQEDIRNKVLDDIEKKSLQEHYPHVFVIADYIQSIKNSLPAMNFLNIPEKSKQDFVKTLMLLEQMKILLDSHSKILCKQMLSKKGAENEG